MAKKIDANSMKEVKIFSIIAIIIALFLFVATAVSTGIVISKVKGTYSTYGTVVAYETSWTTMKTLKKHKYSQRTEMVMTYAPVYQYTVDGETYEASSELYSNIKKYDYGDQCKILVKKNNPEESTLADIFPRGVIIPLITGLVGCIWGGVGYILWRSAQRREKRQQIESTLN